MKNKLRTIAIGTLAVGAIVATGVIGLTQDRVYAADGTYTSLVQNIAAKFNLNQADVQTVIDETRVQNESARLDKAVTAGTITFAQKDLILAKQTEVKAKLDEINNKQLTEAERRTEVETYMTEIQKWATDNSIPQQLLGRGREGRGGRVMMNDGVKGDMMF